MLPGEKRISAGRISRDSRRTTRPSSLAHNASFDVGVLAATLRAYGLAQPAYTSLCTVQASWWRNVTPIRAASDESR
jgi:DNA polymerase III epsilon subunit-like protein